MIFKNWIQTKESNFLRDVLASGGGREGEGLADPLPCLKKIWPAGTEILTPSTLRFYSRPQPWKQAWIRRVRCGKFSKMFKGISRTPFQGCNSIIGRFHTRKLTNDVRFHIRRRRMMEINVFKRTSRLRRTYRLRRNQQMWKWGRTRLCYLVCWFVRLLRRSKRRTKSDVKTSKTVCVPCTHQENLFVQNRCPSFVCLLMRWKWSFKVTAVVGRPRFLIGFRRFY